MPVFWISHEVHGHVFDDGHVLRAIEAAQPCEIVVEGDIENPMEAVLDAPMGSDCGREGSGIEPCRGEIIATLLFDRAVSLDTRLHHADQRFGLDPIRDVQVLCPMQRGALGARALNADLQKALNPNPSSRVERFGSVFLPNDKVMQTENDYDKEVFNGDVGTVVAIDEDEGILIVSFEGREVEYVFNELDTLVPAYAITVHKSQGSEFPAVVITLATQHYTMLARNLLYTAVSGRLPFPSAHCVPVSAS
jgi:ATP-dependent exoDNAse (exonuclease V) alpha subunit